MKCKSLFILFYFLSLPAWAEQKIFILDDIEVSANKEGRTYSETPESVTILPPSRINRGDQSNALEVISGQANVNVQNTRSNETFSIRGVSNTGVTGFQKDNLASVYIDDIFQTDLAMKAGSFEVWDISILEIYRGPQSTSMGVNSLAGAIVLNHNSPTQEDEAALKLGYGSFNRREVGAYANKTFFDKKLAVRLSFNKDMNDGFIKNKTTQNDKWGRQDKGHLVGDIKYFFDDKSELRLLNKFLKTDNGGNYTIGGKPFHYNVYEDVDSQSITNNQQNSLQYIKPLGETLNNKLTLAYSKGLQNNRFDADGHPSARAGVRKEYANDQFISLENVLQYQGPKVKNAFGIHTHTFRSFNHYDFSILFNATPVHVLQDLDKTRETYAIFDSFTYKFAKAHSLNLGLRYELVNNSYGSLVNPLTVTGNAGTDAYLNQVRGSYDGTEKTQVVLPKIGYFYQQNKNTWGVTYTQGYRIGGLDINRSQAKTVEYAPEKTDNYEASWKYTSDRFKAQANIFYTYWKHQQVEVRLSNTDTYNSQVENASKSEVFGGEVEGSYFWKNGNNVRFGVGHVRTHFLSFNNNNTVYTGNEFPDAPEWTAQAAYNHLFTERISSNLTFRHVGQSYTNAENTRSAPEQFYTDINLQYTADSFIWELNAKNILDNKYVLNKSPVYQNLYQRVNRPRELGTRVTFFF